MLLNALRRSDWHLFASTLSTSNMEIFPRRSPLLLVILIAGLDLTTSRYLDDTQPAQQSNPSILVHKQALNDDGSFNYVFAADNGLRQGERILPDGTRVGAYSYVDPNGETISVKYKAGKNGFEILEGAHVPTAPPPPALADDPSSAPSDFHLPTAIPKTSWTTPSPPKNRERAWKDTTPVKRPTFKLPEAGKKLRERGTRPKGPFVMVHRNPNESEQRVASFHMEQPTFRGQVNKADTDTNQPGLDDKPDFFNNDSPKAYSFQFGSA